MEGACCGRARTNMKKCCEARRRHRRWSAAARRLRRCCSGAASRCASTQLQRAPLATAQEMMLSQATESCTGGDFLRTPQSPPSLPARAAQRTNAVATNPIAHLLRAPSHERTVVPMGTHMGRPWGSSQVEQATGGIHQWGSPGEICVDDRHARVAYTESRPSRSTEKKSRTERTQLATKQLRSSH